MEGTKSIQHIAEELNDRLRFSHHRLQDTKTHLAVVKSEAKRQLQDAANNMEELQEELTRVQVESRDQNELIKELESAISRHLIEERNMQTLIQEKDAEVFGLNKKLSMLKTTFEESAQSRDSKMKVLASENVELKSKLEATSVEVQQIKEHVTKRAASDEGKKRHLAGQLATAQEALCKLEGKCSYLQAKADEVDRIVVENSELRKMVQQARRKANVEQSLRRLEKGCGCDCGVDSDLDVDLLQDCQEDTSNYFGNFCEEMEDSEGMKYIQGSHNGKKLLNVCGAWVPLSVVTEIRTNCRGIMPSHEVDLMVLNVSNIYARREKRRLNRLRAKHQETLKRLKRTLQQRAPYEQIISAEKIKFLKRKLEDCQKKWGPKDGECAKILKSALDKTFCMGRDFDRLKQENCSLRKELVSAASHGESWENAYESGAMSNAERSLRMLQDAKKRIDRASFECRASMCKPGCQEGDTVTETVAKFGDEVKAALDDCRIKMSVSLPFNSGE